MRIRILLAAVLLSVSTALCAQPDTHVKSPNPNDVSVGAVRVENRGPRITVSYKILFGNNVRSCDVRLLVSTDGGNTYSFVPDSRNLSGDIGTVTTEGEKSILYDASLDRELLADKALDFKIDIKSKDVLKTETLVALNAGVFPPVSFGVMFGMVKQWGWYVKARTDFSFPSTTLTCNKDGQVEGGGYIWTSGNTKKSRLVITAGGMCRASKWLYPYAGIGYGSRQYCWETYKGEWAKVSDSSCSGLSLDAGVVFKFGKVALTAGVTNTAFKLTEAEIGVGVMF